MTRKPTPVDPRIGNNRVGLMITRGQVEHLGHAALKAQMMLDNGRNIIGFGSSQKSGVFDNPLTSDQKRRAQLGAWGDTFKMVFLQDIGATDRATDWGDYVFDRIRTNQLPEPTDFYAGSKHEARWYEHHFARLDGEPSYRRGAFEVWENPSTRKRIHILDRTLHVAISASEVRTLIERRDPAWRNYVPAKLWDFYEWEYPPELRAAVEIDPEEWMFPIERAYPVGTKLIDVDGTILILRDDGKWRPRTAAESGKSLGD
ncbi:hypothetical protein LAZ40_02385 [Cereibacter sphaeroides]|uniref:hypothetical protein n=1 Tax=Cereibacter sphaeroides TaxID=1063 RepID=UPI001F39A7E0|nr:hypothetical protein [Cereibacter sphaeroides]MCE6957906.1 hypothetical protein [Cereibacter sphaeroides]MCE6971746.1 hypothetical protein [Cereibacter sphaeroides]